MHLVDNLETGVGSVFLSCEQKLHFGTDRFFMQKKNVVAKQQRQARTQTRKLAETFQFKDSNDATASSTTGRT